jgi:hypothetical protein
MGSSVDVENETLLRGNRDEAGASSAVSVPKVDLGNED